MSIGETPGPDYGILAHRFVSSGQWDRSLATSREWLGKDPENLRAHRIAAQSLVNLRRVAEAKPHLEKALAGNPNDDFAHRLMAIVYFDQGRFKAADESIRKALELNPREAYNWYQLALMSYKQGDQMTARRCAEKARERRPRDPDILNLLILCEPNSPYSAANKIGRFEQALELDPENASIHNNIGAQYLGKLKDYEKAEECFRRALFFAPSSQVYRQNLFITLKHRDRVYRALRAPKDFLLKVIAWSRQMRKQSIVLYILLIPLWLLAFRFVLGGLLLWFMLVWPLTKVYEYLTIGDIRAEAGEPGARRGGFLGYRTWSLKLRLVIFAFLLVSFWSLIAWVCANSIYLHGSNSAQAVPGAVLFIALIVFLGLWLRSKMNKTLKAIAARKRARRLATVLRPRVIKRKRRRSFRRII